MLNGELLEFPKTNYTEEELAYHYILNGVYAYLKTVKPTICKAVFND